MGLPGLNTYRGLNLVNIPKVTIPCVAWHNRTVGKFHDMKLGEKIAYLFKAALIYPTLSLLWFTSLFARTKPIPPAPKDPYLEKVKEINALYRAPTLAENNSEIKIPSLPCLAAIHKEIDGWENLIKNNPTAFYRITTDNDTKEGKLTDLKSVKNEAQSLKMPPASSFYYSATIIILKESKYEVVEDKLNGRPNCGSWGTRKKLTYDSLDTIKKDYPFVN